MKIKDVEKRFEKAADEMKLRSFSERWEIIKEDITVPAPKKKPSWKKWLPTVTAACLIFISASIIIPIALNNQLSGGLFVPEGGTSVPTTPNNNSSETQKGNEDEQTYFMPSEMGQLAYGENINGLYQHLSSSNFEIVDISGYFISSSVLYYITDETSEEQIIKGCQIIYLDDEDNATFVLDLQIYDDSVQIKNWKPVSYIKSYSYTANQTEVEYWCTDFDGEMYSYRIKARYKNLNYYIGYDCFEENIEPFLDEFFK